jgi:hypothetical protein
VTWTIGAANRGRDGELSLMLLELESLSNIELDLGKEISLSQVVTLAMSKGRDASPPLSIKQGYGASHWRM